MRNWKVVLGLSICTSLCGAALANAPQSASLSQRTAQDAATTAVKIEMLRSMTAATRTGSQNPFATGETAGALAGEYVNMVDDGSVKQTGEEGQSFSANSPEAITIGDNTCATAPTVSCGEAGIIFRFETPMAADPENEPSCSGAYFFQDSVWAKFVATARGAKIRTCDPAPANVPLLSDLCVAVFRTTNPGSPCGANLIEIACRDNTVGCGTGLQPGEMPELIACGLNPGDTYWIVAGARSWSGGQCGTGPCTQGDYLIQIDCNDIYDPPQLTINPSIAPEDELVPADATNRVNDGCNQDGAPAFAAITCGEQRRGTCTFDGTTRDTDWYELIIDDVNVTSISMSVQAEFVANMFIIKPGTPSECDDSEVLAANDPGSFQISGPASTIEATGITPGKYWIFVAPDFCYGVVECGFDYILTVNTNPCIPATGACCNGTSCSELAAEDCVGGSNVYYGDNTDCQTAGFACYQSFGGTSPPQLKEPETLACPAHGTNDTINSGCGGNDVSPPLTIVNPANRTVNGTSATYFNNAPPNNTDNVRDNDYYRMNMNYSGGPTIAVNAFGRILVDIRTEFRAQVLIVSPQLSNPCATFGDDIILDQVVEPGVQTQLRTCVLRRDADAPFGDVWVVVRPFVRGTPRELPCGRRYSFKVTTQVCDGVGACCVITPAGVSSGCQQLSAAACAAASGVFNGENSLCADICCVCEQGLPNENEPDCGIGGSDDTVNGGCNSDTVGYPFDTTHLDQPGDIVCGTSTFNGTTRDTDWYVYNHPGGDINYCIQSSFITLGFILKPGPGGTIQQQCDGLEVLASDSLTEADCGAELCLTAANQPAGVYWLWAGPNFDAAFACGGAYRARVFTAAATLTGRCCIPFDPNNPNNPSGCLVTSQTECAALGGQFAANQTCYPNVCCTPAFDCDPNATIENEPTCDDPNTPVNGGCNSSPPVFGAELAVSGAKICGITKNDTVAGNRDTDWFSYTHAGGDIVWFVDAEFLGTSFLIGPIYNENDICCASYDTFTLDFNADCGGVGAFVADAPAGNYQFVIVPSFDNGPLPCGAAYNLQVASGVQGACCFASDCGISYEDICVTNGGTWQGDGSDCDPSPCAPALCPGDMNCDGTRNFADIDPFVLALQGQAAYQAQFPNCQWLNGDTNGDNTVNFGDIDPFVALLGAGACP